MLVAKLQGQEIEDLDVVKIKRSYGSAYYIVWYYMPTTSFVLYPLGGHSLGKEQVFLLDDIETEWEYLGNIADQEVYSQINIPGPYETFKENLELYMSNVI